MENANPKPAPFSKFPVMSDCPMSKFDMFLGHEGGVTIGDIAVVAAAFSSSIVGFWLRWEKERRANLWRSHALNVL